MEWVERNLKCWA